MSNNILKISGTVAKTCFRFCSKSTKCRELVSLGEMPIPEGSFFKLYHQRQRRHNSVLALGIIMFTTAVTLYSRSNINMNFSPPETYE
jgi:Deltamethrin resistance